MSGDPWLRSTWSQAKQHPKLLIGCTVLFLGIAATTSWRRFYRSFRADEVDEVREGQADVTLNGVLEIIHGREVVWQIPDSSAQDDLKGVAFFAHGCSHRAIHFWPRSGSCDTCTGLPEDARNVKVTLSRGFAVIAISSKNVCWDARMPPDKSVDASDIVHVLRHWRARHNLDSLSLVAMGASSGGYFVSTLAHAVKIDALVIMIASGVEEAFTERPDFGYPYPPTLFIHMPRDEETAYRVKKNMKILKSQGVESTEIQCAAMKIGPSFLSSRIEGMDPGLSSKIFNALEGSGLVNGLGLLLPQFRDSWKGALQGKGMNLETGLEEKISEELNLAYGYHEMTSEYANEMVDWFGVPN